MKEEDYQRALKDLVDRYIHTDMSVDTYMRRRKALDLKRPPRPQLDHARISKLLGSTMVQSDDTARFGRMNLLSLTGAARKAER